MLKFGVMVVLLAVMILAVIMDVKAADCVNDASCNGHGVCNDTNTPCVCTGGYSGDDCLIVCTDGGSECGTHGTCNITVTPVKCGCDSGFTGDHCTQQSGGNRVTFLAQLLLIPIVLSRYTQ